MDNTLDLNAFRNGTPGAANRMISLASNAGIGLLPLDVFHENPTTKVSGNLPNISEYRNISHSPGEWLQAAVMLESVSLAGRFKVPRFGKSNRVLVGNALNMSAEKLEETSNTETPPDQVFEGGYLIGGRGGSVYGHWLLDFIPQLIIALRIKDKYGFDFPLLVTNCPKFAIGLIDILGVREKCVFMGIHKKYSVNRLIVPMITKHGRRYSTTALSEMFNVLHPHEPEKYKRKLLIHRKKQPFANNFDALREKLIPKGFEVVCPEDHSFIEQFSLFQSADVIVGEDGSALHNAGFCKPGGRLIVYSRGDKVNYWHASVAEAAGLSLTYLQSKNARSGHAAPIDDICAALDKS